MKNSQQRPKVVIDAGIAIRLVLPLSPTKTDVVAWFSDLVENKVRFTAPEIWIPEIVSVIRRLVFNRMIEAEEAKSAIEDLFSLETEIVGSDLQLCQKALRWSNLLGQSKAYDAFYMAVAERLNADFWTADKRLFNGAKQLGVDWIRLFE